jgi:tetrahydromethanopterin S-methyltransferase subunit G
LSGAYAVFGPSISVERSVGLLYGLVILIAAFRIAKALPAKAGPVKVRA